MGFDPATIKRPEPHLDNPTRDARVLTLAQELHKRGVTVSLADAKRLAEGMVDVERKVISEGSRKPEPSSAAGASERQRIQSSDPMFKAAGVSVAPPTVPANAGAVSALALSADFDRFVNQVAGAASERPVDVASVSRPSAPVPAPRDVYAMSSPSPKSAPTTYGRNDEFHSAQVPHTSARKQMFFDDAPPLSQLRGFQNAGGVPEALKHRGFQGTEQAGPRTARLVVEPAPIPIATQGPAKAEFESAESQIDAVSFDAAPKAPEPAAGIAPGAEERFAVAPEPVVAAVVESEPRTPDAPQPQRAEASAPVPLEQTPKEDLAAAHGVDIFQMFKTKK